MHDEECGISDIRSRIIMTDIHHGGTPQPLPAEETSRAEPDKIPRAELREEAKTSKKRKAEADPPGHVDKKSFTLRVFR